MSSETRGSQSESVENNNNTNPSSSNNSNSNQNERSQSSNNTNESIQINISETSNTNTEPPQPAITRKHHSSMSGILDEIPPPPYSKDSNMQTTSSSHSRDHTQITITSLPEYTVSDSSHSTITTQPQVIPIPSHRHSLSNDALLSSKLCKICQESEDSSDNKNKLISPCKCKGSLQYVHIECLNQWRNSNVREDASYRCEVCKYEYKFYRPRIAKIFSNALTLHFLTLLLLLSSIYFFSYLVKLLDSHDKTNHGNNPNNPPHKFFNRWRNIHFLNLRLIHIIYGSAIVSLFGLIFFMCLVCFNGFRTARTEYCYCGGFGHPFCYGSYGCDCNGADSDCGVIIILIALVILAVLFVFGFVGAVIAAYLFTQKIISVCLEKVHDRILEVKKD